MVYLGEKKFLVKFDCKKKSVSEMGRKNILLCLKNIVFVEKK